MTINHRSLLATAMGLLLVGTYLAGQSAGQVVIEPNPATVYGSMPYQVQPSPSIRPANFPPGGGYPGQATPDFGHSQPSPYFGDANYGPAPAPYGGAYPPERGAILRELLSGAIDGYRAYQDAKHRRMELDQYERLQNQNAAREARLHRQQLEAQERMNNAQLNAQQRAYQAQLEAERRARAAQNNRNGGSSGRSRSPLPLPTPKLPKPKLPW